MREGQGRQSGASTRAKIVDATASLLEERGIAELTVSAIMTRASVSRTAFYRQFDRASDVLSALMESLLIELESQAGAWFTDVEAVGSRDVVWENALRDGRAIKPRIRLLRAIVDATAVDEPLRTMWRATFTQSWVDATAAAIRRDQAVGAIRPGLDPDTTALALTLMSEQLALEVLGLQDGTPEAYAAILTPIWGAVLFGIDDTD